LATLQAVQAGAINKGSVAPLSWSALSQELAQRHAPGIEYQRFLARWNDPQDPIKASGLVKKFDKNGLVIDTNSPEENPEVQGQPAPDVLDRTAMSATKRAQ
jgi:hypothetical protein